MRSLVVDDSRTMRSILGRQLKALGFEVVEAEHGRDALDKLPSAGPIDLALVDWNMPEMDGPTLIRAMRADPRWADTPIMMVTSEADLSSVGKAIGFGANEYMIKPFDKDSLLLKLQSMGLAPGTEA